MQFLILLMILIIVSTRNTFVVIGVTRPEIYHIIEANQIWQTPLWSILLILTSPGLGPSTFYWSALTKPGKWKVMNMT